MASRETTWQCTLSRDETAWIIRTGPQGAVLEVRPFATFAHEPTPEDFAAAEQVARLATAAPALLAALEAVAQVIEEWPSIHAEGDYLHGWPLIQAREAIRRAKGES
jgi:hypothetical protein